jgi:hypothetical protein
MSTRGMRDGGTTVSRAESHKVPTQTVKNFRLIGSTKTKNYHAYCLGNGSLNAWILLSSVKDDKSNIETVARLRSFKLCKEYFKKRIK